VSVGMNRSASSIVQSQCGSQCNSGNTVETAQGSDKYSVSAGVVLASACASSSQRISV
jgi:hypothetical protein